MSDSTKELADRLDAEKRLRGHGYKKEACPHCHGLGGIQGCGACENKGYKWASKEVYLR